MTEEHKRLRTRITMYGSWVAALATVTLQVTGVIEPGVYGIVAVLFMAFAIAAGQAILRYKLSDTIVGAFEAGMKAAQDERQAQSVRAERHHREVMQGGRSG